MCHDSQLIKNQPSSSVLLILCQCGSFAAKSCCDTYLAYSLYAAGAWCSTGLKLGKTGWTSKQIANFRCIDAACSSGAESLMVQKDRVGHKE